MTTKFTQSKNECSISFIDGIEKKTAESRDNRKQNLKNCLIIIAIGIATVGIVLMLYLIHSVQYLRCQIGNTLGLKVCSSPSGKCFDF